MEKKEEVYLGKHYRMKQAFGQEELHQREAVCTREEPPGCQAACPLHLDMRAVCGHEDADACREVRKAGLDDIARIRRDFENGGIEDGSGMDS